jgi:hypothetical protein
MCNEAVSEALERFFKISGSIERFIMRETGLLKFVRIGMIVAIAFNKTIKYLNLDEDANLAKEKTNEKVKLGFLLMA